MAAPVGDARAAAVRVLVSVEQGHATLADAVATHRESVAPRDRALLLETVTGAVRWQAAIDARIAAVSTRRLSDLDPVVRAILRIGVYQLTYLDRVPAHAVVHESVAASRRMKLSSAAGFVNAVLRAVQRSGPAGPLPSRPESAAPRDAWVRYLSITLSHPEWLVRRWLDRYGPEATETWCRFNNTPPVVTVRLRGGVDRARWLERLTTLGVEHRGAEYVGDAVQLPPGGSGRLGPDEWRDAAIQDEGSQLVAHAAAAAGGDRVLDLCASPGGKTVILATGDRPPGLVVACDFRPPRIALLRATLGRAGVSAPIVRLDAAAPLPFPPVFDTVLVDAPCSGLGTLRRDPDLKWSRVEPDLERLAGVELTILSRAAGAVAAGGTLVYATCSSEPEENEDVVARFLAAHPDFAIGLVTFPPVVANAADLVNERGQLRTFPFRHRLDAYFAAALRRS